MIITNIPVSEVQKFREEANHFWLSVKRVRGSHSEAVRREIKKLKADQYYANFMDGNEPYEGDDSVCIYWR